MDKNKIKSIPKELCSLPQLETLSLSHNEISKIPEELCCLKKLTKLFIGNNVIPYFAHSEQYGNNLQTIKKYMSNMNKCCLDTYGYMEID